MSDVHATGAAIARGCAPPTRVAILLMTSVVAACATVTSGGSQTITVQTQPPGADCRFSREGITIARVNPTPGHILVGKAYDTIAVRCSKPGFEDADGAMGPGFQPLTIGNALLGGIVGVVIDAATGAMATYPDEIVLRLAPQTFADAAGRDRFYAELAQSFQQEYERVAARIAKACAPADCERQLQVIEEGRRARLDDIEQRRQLASVRAN